MDSPPANAFFSILNSLDQGVALFDKNRHLLYTNPRMKRVTGGRNGIGWSLSDLIDRHQLFDAGGLPVRVEDFPINRAFNGEDSKDELYEYVDPSGHRTYLYVTCLRILDARGELEYVVTTVRDVSAGKADENKLQFLVESAKVLSLQSNLKQRLTEKAKLTVPVFADWCAIDLVREEAVERVVVVHRDPVMINYVYELDRRFPPEASSPLSSINVVKIGQPQFVQNITDEMIRASAKSEEQYRAISLLQLKSLMVVPIMSGNKGLGTMTLAYAESGRTYTEEDVIFFQEFCYHLGVVIENGALYDEISRRDEAKDHFLASLSHELRNPLAPIKASLELIKLEPLPQNVREGLGVIEHSFDHMAKLLNDLLDVSRLTTNTIPVILRPIDLRLLVERALKASSSLLQRAQIALHVSEPADPVCVMGDETRLEQALMNLISNAVKFTPAGGSLWVELAQRDGEARIAVRDNGAGIHAEDLPHVFDMYYQGRRVKSPTGGIGLGLLLVRKIAELHGGVVEAHSEGPERGSEFAITLPLSKQACSLPTPASLSCTAHQKKRVHVVDDNCAAGDSLAKLLNKLGAEASVSYSGDEILNRPDVYEFDLILLDIGMPHMDGYEVIRQLREMGVSKPVVALTGYGMNEDKERARTRGFDGHLTKPIGLKELNELFEEVFAG